MKMDILHWRKIKEASKVDPSIIGALNLYDGLV